MACSPARLAANRQNALKSTGPRTPEGKAAARLNAFQHGMAGEGNLLAPGEDAQLVAARASAFARELDAPGTVGLMLAHRAALLSVRMERAASREEATIIANVAAAHLQFDQDRQAALDAAIGALAALGDPRPALVDLEALPEGVAHLIVAWRDLHAAVERDHPDAAPRAVRWLGLTEPPADLRGRIDAELARLHRQAAALGSVAEATAIDRHNAGLRATFDPAPEATLARRYEAAAERGMYRALHTITALRRAREEERLAVPLETVLGRGSSPPSSPPPAVVPPRGNPEPLGSFRAGVLAPPTPLAQAILGAIPPASLPPEPRKKRPDLRKIGQNRR